MNLKIDENKKDWSNIFLLLFNFFNSYAFLYLYKSISEQILSAKSTILCFRSQVISKSHFMSV